MAYNIPPELVEYFKNKQSSLLIGAGLSLGAGLPSWEKLMQLMIKRYSSLPYFQPDKIVDYQDLIKEKSKFLMLAEDLKESLGPKIYVDFLDEIFGNPSIDPTPNHYNIIKLDPSFIITLNYDRDRKSVV